MAASSSNVLAKEEDSSECDIDYQQPSSASSVASDSTCDISITSVSTIGQLDNDSEDEVDDGGNRTVNVEDTLEFQLDTEVFDGSEVQLPKDEDYEAIVEIVPEDPAGSVRVEVSSTEDCFNYNSWIFWRCDVHQVLLNDQNYEAQVKAIEENVNVTNVSLFLPSKTEKRDANPCKFRVSFSLSRRTVMEIYY